MFDGIEVGIQTVLAGLAILGIGHKIDKGAGKSALTGWKTWAAGVGTILTGLGQIGAALANGST